MVGIKGVEMPEDCSRCERCFRECKLSYDFKNYLYTRHSDCPLVEIEEPKTDGDYISRQALIERINNAEENFKADNMESIASDDGDPFVDGVLSGVFNIRQMVIQAPSVTPKQKTGHWDKGYTFPDGEYWMCTNCKELIKVKYPMKYCNNCGSKNK